MPFGGFSDIVNRTVQLGSVIYPTVRFGAGLKYSKRKQCGSVRVSKIVNGAVRFVVECVLQSVSAVRCGCHIHY